ncbi:30S ribosomal protein S3ae [Candidatus Nitrosocosmicus franklandus]|uniref:Small ribosomal subunit protein eS1 n=1 Tax=Candidatus Nitrosocosmicus franklandianus TaxID=1798806 RepID=A0A484IE15_9ARCH|nr:30S ribosomal protein S3ae [Candidatus Nitrosocosmicus franklandus]VFJ15047.1 30S ribosomal protein S3Ae [Candidatus Nitrosocosmicus franklandus]
MAKGSRRGGRVRDKWRDKQWIVVNAPAAFDQVPLNYIPVSDVTNAKGRVIENTLYDILKQDPTQHQTKIFVQIDRINAGIASTIFKGHEYAKEFLRSLIRRGSSMINFVDEYTTADGYLFRVSVTAFSQRRINSAKKHEIRLSMDRVLREKIPALTLNDFIKEVTMGKMASEMMEEAKKIAVIRHVGVRKTKLISSPLQTEETKVNSNDSDEIESISDEKVNSNDSDEIESISDEKVNSNT